jgi:excisionase family DNA binding protein
VTPRGGTAGLPRLLSVRAVAEATTLPPSTVYDLVARGDLPAVRIGRAVRVDERDVLRFIESHREVAL